MKRKFVWNLSALAGAILLVSLFTLLREEPPAVPLNETHRPLLNKLTGGGSVEEVQKECATCHNSQQVPLPDGHPSGDKCLACHGIGR